MSHLYRMAVAELETLLTCLTQQHFQLIGPTIRDGAIAYEEIASAAELPRGWGDEQDKGSYRLKKREDEAYFGYASGAQSWKRFLHPPHVRLWQATWGADGFDVTREAVPVPRYAFIGMRACDLHALEILDRVYLQGPYVDPGYRARREALFLVAVNCTQAGGTCFCASMGTGPRASTGFDLALTEILDAVPPYLVVEVGSSQGQQLMEHLGCPETDPIEARAAEQVVARTAAQMGRTVDTEELPALLYRNYEHPRWEQVAARCLSCGNCTMVCPTCFCTTVTDVTDLSGQQAARWRAWDSCFTMDFSYLHGGSVRASTRSRYRQWMTHKLATWHEQFGSSGCVGCGRCITWCPVGIDITEELRAIRTTGGAEGANDDKA